MDPLFIHIYADEDVGTLVATLVRSRGFAATTTGEAGNLGKADTEQLAYAAASRMAMITHNRGDFEALAQHYFASAQTHWGIIIAVRRPPHDILRRLLVILDDVTADEMKNHVLYL